MGRAWDRRASVGKRAGPRFDRPGIAGDERRDVPPFRSGDALLTVGSVVRLAARERALEERVRAWATPEFGSEPELIERAVEVALEALHAGKSVPEASESALAYLLCWSRHPSHRAWFPVHPAA